MVGVFLSHSSKDKPFVRDLADALEAGGEIKVWLDEREIDYGENIVLKIADGLDADFALLILSPDSVDSKWGTGSKFFCLGANERSQSCMRSHDLNPEETGRAIMRLKAEQSSDFDFPQLIPVERAAELLYGPTVWTSLLRNLHSAWDNTIDFLHMPVHKIEDFTEGELLFTPGGLIDFLEERKQVKNTSPLYEWKSSPTILTEAFGSISRT